MSATSLRFYGAEDSVQDWRTLLADVLGVQATEVVQRAERRKHPFMRGEWIDLPPRYTCDAALTDEQRDALMPYWYGETGDRRWNEAINFKEV